jgi:hypothetical protein
VLLTGIVFFNVDLLKMNHGIAATDVRAGKLKRENAVLTLELAKLGSSERIQRVALERGLVLPQPGDVQYLQADSKDARLALRVMTAPDPISTQTSAPAPVSQVSPPPPATPTTAPTATPQPTVVAQQPAATVPAQTQQTTQPAATQPAPAPATGAAAAPTG